MDETKFDKKIEQFEELVDLRHREERRKLLDEERKKSDELYAKKEYEKAVRWAVIFIASGVFIAVVNAITGGIISKILQLYIIT